MTRIDEKDAVAGAAVLMMVGLTTGPAAADSHTTTAGPGDSYQTQYWERGNGGKVRHINRTDGLDPNRCIDSIIDWDTNGSGHYDSRIVRNCATSGIVYTGGTDGWWSEGWGANNCCPPYTGPPLWVELYARVIVGVRRGGGYAIRDTNLEPIPGADTDQTWAGAPPNPVPPTQNDGGSRVRTLYQSGTIGWTEPYHNDWRSADPNAN